MSTAHEERIRREEATWTGPKLIALLVVTLAVAFGVLYAVSG